MAKFDIEAARAAQYTDAEIAEFLLSTEAAQKARDAKWTDAEILAYFGLNQIEGPARLPAMVASNALEGAANMVTLPAEIEKLGNELLPKIGLEFLTRPVFSLDEQGLRFFPEGEKAGSILPSTEMVKGGLKSIGAIDRPDLLPQDQTERYAASMAEGIGGTLPFVLSGGAGTVPMLLGGAAGGAGAELGNELMPDSPLASIALGFAGGLGGQAIASGVEKGIARTFADKELQEALDELAQLKAGEKPTRWRMKDERESLLRAAGKEFENAKTVADLARAKALADHQALIGQTANALGKSATLQEAGTALQNSARGWLRALPGKLKSVWAPLDKAVGATPVEVDLSAFSSALREINKSAGELEPLASLLKPGVPKALQERLSAIFAKNDLTGLPDTFSWADVQKLRTTLGDALADPVLMKSVGAQNLDRLYATLTADMREAADSIGAKDLFDEANNNSRNLYEIAEGFLSNVVAGPRPSSTDPLPEKAAQLLLSQGKLGGTGLDVLRGEIPDAMNELAAAGLKQGLWSKFAPEAKGALLPDQVVRSSLDASEAAAVAGKDTYTAALKAAAKARENLAAKARETYTAGTRDLETKLSAAQARQLRAQIAAGNLAPDKVQMTYPWATIPGGIAGAEILFNSMGLHGYDITRSAAGAMVGAMAPWTFKQMKNVLSSPGGGVGAASGALAGAEDQDGPLMIEVRGGGAEAKP
jgi:hypothetical protein